MSKELAVTLEDKPGTLAKLAEALGTDGVNIEAFAVVPGSQGNCRIVVADSAKARKALEGAGMRITSERDAIVADLDDTPGALGKAARKLASAGVNIESSYVAGQSGGKKKVVFSVNDAAKAKGVLG